MSLPQTLGKASEGAKLDLGEVACSVFCAHTV